MMSSRDAVLPGLVQALETNAHEIDVTFATAGRQLGEGLSLFEELKQRLSSLSNELSSDDLAQAGRALAGLSLQLRLLDGGLSDEMAGLQVLAKHSHQVSSILDCLLGHMRLITILSRSARIEAISVRTSEHDFGDFTNEIVALIHHAQDTIRGCVRDQERLNKLLEAALTAQLDFQTRYAGVLSKLAHKLEQTLAEIRSRQDKSATLTSDAAVLSGKIAMAAGGAIIALQSGDAIRQRLEHAIAALRLAQSLAERTTPDLDLGEAERMFAAAALRRLEASQLHQSAQELNGDAAEIESALALLAGDTAKIVDLVAVLYRGEEGGANSFLLALEADLVEASDLLGKCHRARSGIDHVTAALTGVLDACQQTVQALASTVSSIVLIGMNAGLRAARLGSGGRSLVLIAQELKTVADQIATDAARLDPTFAEMQAASGGLRRAEAGEAGDLDGVMNASLEVLRRTGERLGAALDRLTRDGNGFGAVVARARLSFSNAGAMSDVIASAADQLAVPASIDGNLEPAGAQRVRDMIQERVWPSYTMASERTIHRDVMAELGLDESAPHEARPVEQVDDFLF